MEKENVLISACLMGVNCRMDGGSKQMEGWKELMDQYHLIPICPETLGGLSTPRDPSERSSMRVVSSRGADVTQAFTRGAEEVLKLAKLYQCRYAILKEKSPSCGSGKIYDGTFSKHLIDGDGVCAELLKKHGIVIIGDSQASKELLPPEKC